MTLGKKSIACPFVALTLIWLAGCGSSSADAEDAEGVKKTQFTQIYDVVTVYAKKHQQQPPSKLSDLQPFELINPVGIRALKDNTIVLNFGVAPNKSSRAILAYEKDADKQGGLALLADGNMKKLTAEEMKSAGKTPNQKR